MKLTKSDYIVDFSQLEDDDMVEAWRWLVGFDKIPVMVSSIGDMFLKDEAENIYWLDIGEGKFEKIAESIDEFNLKLKDSEQVDEWFLPELIKKIKASGLELKPGFLFGYKKLPILGGEYDPTNFEITDIDVHFALAGQIHEQIKNLPNGTKIRNFSISD